MISVRKATPEDLGSIVNFQVEMAMETENHHLDKPTVEKGVSAVFADSSKGTYFVVEKDGVVVASLLTTYEWSDWRNGTTLWIQSVYVDRNFRGQGAYRALYSYIKEMVDNDPNYTGIRLYVYKDNLKAKSVYSNLGMKGDFYEIYEWMKD